MDMNLKSFGKAYLLQRESLSLAKTKFHDKFRLIALMRSTFPLEQCSRRGKHKLKKSVSYDKKN